MLVSMNFLSLIHLVAGELAAGRGSRLPNVPHQSTVLLRIILARDHFIKPVAEHLVQCLVLNSGDLARLVDEVVLGAEGKVFHTNPVYTTFVQKTRPPGSENPNPKRLNLTAAAGSAAVFTLVT